VALNVEIPVDNNLRVFLCYVRLRIAFEDINVEHNIWI